jgi:hypothetical protein
LLVGRTMPYLLPFLIQTNFKLQNSQIFPKVLKRSEAKQVARRVRKLLPKIVFRLPKFCRRLSWVLIRKYLLTLNSLPQILAKWVHEGRNVAHGETDFECAYLLCYSQIIQYNGNSENRQHN